MEAAGSSARRTPVERPSGLVSARLASAWGRIGVGGPAASPPPAPFSLPASAAPCGLQHSMHSVSNPCQDEDLRKP